MSKGPWKLLIIGNMRKGGVREQINSLLPWLKQHADVLAVIPSHEPLPQDLPRADLCAAFGGDGTLLAAARVVAEAGVPLLGVNMGKLGFLAEFSVEHFQRHLVDILAAGVPCTRRMMLNVCVSRGGRKAFCSLVTNDVCIA